MDRVTEGLMLGVATLIKYGSLASAVSKSIVLTSRRRLQQPHRNSSDVPEVEPDLTAITRASAASQSSEDPIVSLRLNSTLNS